MKGDWIVPLVEMEFVELLSLTAIVTTVGMFLCGVPICLRIRAKGGTEGISPAPFLIGTISCFYWTRYGFLRQDSSLVTVNALGLSLQASYLCYFWSRARLRSTLNRLIGLICLFCILMLLWVKRMEESGRREAAVDGLGSVCVFLNVANFSAPLAGLKDVIRLASTENLPFPLCLANLLVSIQWLLYGYLVEDFYLELPNVIGIVLALLQLSLFLVYPSRRSSSKTFAPTLHA